VAERQNWDDHQLVAFIDESEDKLVRELGERATERAVAGAPVLVPTRAVPLPGEHWSMPGRLKASLSTGYGHGIDGHAEATISADRVYRFAHKHEHAIRAFIGEAVASLIGEQVP
jgi:hypothetical protein